MHNNNFSIHPPKNEQGEETFEIDFAQVVAGWANDDFDHLSFNHVAHVSFSGTGAIADIHQMDGRNPWYFVTAQQSVDDLYLLLWLNIERWSLNIASLHRNAETFERFKQQLPETVILPSTEQIQALFIAFIQNPSLLTPMT